MLDLSQNKPMTLLQVAEYTQMSVRKIWYLIEKDCFCKTKKLGNSIRVLPKDLNEWIESCDVKKYQNKQKKRQEKKVLKSIKIN